MNQPFNDRRRHRRFIVDAMGIRGRARVEGEVAINDISIGGVSIKTERRLDLGRRYTVRISQKGRDIYLQGRVTSSSENDTRERPDESSPLKFAASLQFTDISQETMADLMKFIEAHRHEKKTPVQVHQMSSRRANLRFPLGSSGNTTFVVTKPFKVRMVSLGGITIESAHLHELGSELQMELTLPENVHLSCKGKVTSCFPAENRPAGHYDAGIKFTEISPQDRAKMKELIRSLYLKDAGFAD